MVTHRKIKWPYICQNINKISAVKSYFKNIRWIVKSSLKISWNSQLMNPYFKFFSLLKASLYIYLPPFISGKYLELEYSVLSHIFALEKSMVKRKFTEKNIFLCMTAYRCDAFMNHTENMSLEIKENNMFIQRMCPKVPQ